jgi:hypothetical protein
MRRAPTTPRPDRLVGFRRVAIANASVLARTVLGAAVVLAQGLFGHRATPGAARWTGLLPRIAGGLVIGLVGLGIANVLIRATVWSADAHLTVASWLWTCMALVAVLGIVPPATAGSGPSPGGPDRVRPRESEEVLK